jgi:hypothetical protein
MKVPCPSPASGGGGGVAHDWAFFLPHLHLLGSQTDGNVWKDSSDGHGKPRTSTSDSLVLDINYLDPRIHRRVVSNKGTTVACVSAIPADNFQQ